MLSKSGITPLKQKPIDYSKRVEDSRLAASLTQTADLNDINVSQVNFAFTSAEVDVGDILFLQSIAKSLNDHKILYNSIREDRPRAPLERFEFDYTPLRQMELPDLRPPLSEKI